MLTQGASPNVCSVESPTTWRFVVSQDGIAQSVAAKTEQHSHLGKLHITPTATFTDALRQPGLLFAKMVYFWFWWWFLRKPKVTWGLLKSYMQVRGLRPSCCTYKPSHKACEGLICTTVKCPKEQTHAGRRHFPIPGPDTRQPWVKAGRNERARTLRPCKQGELKEEDDLALRGQQKGEVWPRACGLSGFGSEKTLLTQSKEATYVQPHTDGSTALPPSKRFLWRKGK